MGYFLFMWVFCSCSIFDLASATYNTRTECEAAFKAAYGEGLDPNNKVLHMCIKAQTISWEGGSMSYSPPMSPQPQPEPIPAPQQPEFNPEPQLDPLLQPNPDQ